MIIVAQNLRVQIRNKEILHGIDLSIPEGKITVLLGPNGSGKSTTLKALCRLLPYQGCVKFADREVKSYDTGDFARQVAILAQCPLAPEDLTVLDLVKMGRFPYRKMFCSGKDDEVHVGWALEQTGLTLMKDRILRTLSGGERQRAWIAMALAQQPRILFLDEPTSYMDICHQLEIMNLVRRLNRELNLTVVMVLHDITQAVNIADYMVVIRDGLVAAAGESSIVNQGLLKTVFRVQAEEFQCVTGERVLVPVSLEE